VIWPVNAVLIFAYAISMGIAFQSGKLPVVIFDTIIPFAFATGAINLTLLGKITGKAYLKMAGLLSGAAMIGCVFMLGNPALYYVAAAGVLLTGVLPSILQMRDEQA